MLQISDYPNASRLSRLATFSSESPRKEATLVYHKGKDIPLFDRDIYFVQQGIVQLSSLDHEGNSILLGLASAGMPFGLPLTSIEAYQAKALSTVSLVRFAQSEIEQYFDLNRLILRGLDMRLQQAEVIHFILCSRHVKEKLYRFLGLLCKEIGEPVSDGTRLKAKFTHENLASAIGTTRVTVTRILSDLRQDGLLLIDEKRHIIMKPLNNG
jgi:CRP-like cAMP-binding protein